ncbi:hypothetical protein WICPIJ_004490 [Wickerhamomyces pijperi]|uniref:Transcription factor domain-containing protein n=1 Tax=Wickerhamomyces pijperi TaxID=599730 RepID=A0A9P8Q7K3_WICPI|nr:hypothetical protein WICPIJ_004490 [Wickerhamomyces pijperi]
MDLPTDQPKKKRQRLIQSCQFCRRHCVYDNDAELRKLRNQGVSSFQVNKPTGADSTGVSPSFGYNNDSEPSTTTSTTTRRATSGSVSSASVTSPATDEDTIDPFKVYPTLQARASPDQDPRPLTHLSFARKDPYFSIFKYFSMLYFHIGCQFINDVNNCEEWKSSTVNTSTSTRAKTTNTNTNTNTKASLLDRWLTLNTVRAHSPKLCEFYTKMSADRNVIINFDGSHSLGGCFSNQLGGYDKLLTEMKAVIPLRRPLQSYLEFFFETMWCHMPVLDEEQFTSEISRVISFDCDTGIPEIHVSRTLDFAVVAQLVLIIRYASVALSLIPDDQLEAKYLWLKKEKEVSVAAVNVMQSYIRMAMAQNLPTMATLQCMLLLRLYLRDCPEGDDEFLPLSTQLTTSYIMQCAISLGLARDPDDSVYFENSKPEAKNLRRRIWGVLTTLEAETTVMNGAIPCNPEPCFVNVKSEEEPTPPSMDPLTETFVKEWGNNQEMNQVYKEICTLFNRLDSRIKVSDIDAVLAKQSSLVNELYTLTPLPPKHYSIKGISTSYTTTAFQNTRYFSKKLIQTAVEVQVYHILTTHYETIPFNNKGKYLVYMAKSLNSIHEMLNLCLSYLTGQLSSFIPAAFRFTILPLIGKALTRAEHVYVSYILHLYHALEIIHRGQLPVSENTVLSINVVIDTMLSQMEYFMSIFHDELSMRYWSALRSGTFHRSMLAILKKYKFTTIGGVLRVLHGHDDGIAHIGEVDKEATRNIRDKLIRRENVRTVMKSWEYRKVNLNSNIGDPVPLSVVYDNLFASITQGEIDHLNKLLRRELPHFKDFHDCAVRCTQENALADSLEASSYNLDPARERPQSADTGNATTPHLNVDNTPTLGNICHPDPQILATATASQENYIVNNVNPNINMQNYNVIQTPQENNYSSDQFLNYANNMEIDLNFDFSVLDDFNDSDDFLLNKIFQS